MNKKAIYFILVLGFVLRFYHLEENFIFSGEVGHNLLAIKSAFLSRQIPLIGPPTSHEWMYFGPLFYWIYGPILILSRFNPISHAYFGAFCSFLIVVLNYLVIKKIFNERVALFSTALLAVSPLFLEFGRAGRFFSVVTILIYPLLFFLYKVIHKEKKYFFWLGFVYGCMFSFHFTPIMLFPFIVTMLILRKVTLSWKYIRNGVVGFILPMIPFLLYDAMNGFGMIRNILLWIPYRIAGFVGLYPKNTVSKAVVENNVSSLYDFFSSSFFPDSYKFLGTVVLVTLLVFIVVQLFVAVKQKKMATSLLLMFIWFTWGYLAIFVHGSPPIHYFVPLLPLPILLFSIMLDYLSLKRVGYVVSLGVLSLMVLFNIVFLLQSGWYFPANDVVRKQPFYVPYSLQKRVAKTIVNDASGRPFKLKRVGPDDQFEDDYAQNYIYLLWLYGNEPVKKADIIYTIYDDQRQIRQTSTSKKIDVSNIVIIKEDKGS